MTLCRHFEFAKQNQHSDPSEANGGFYDTKNLKKILKKANFANLKVKFEILRFAQNDEKRKFFFKFIVFSKKYSRQSVISY